jgi:hypothetical protein
MMNKKKVSETDNIEIFFFMQIIDTPCVCEWTFSFSLTAFHPISQNGSLRCGCTKTAEVYWLGFGRGGDVRGYGEV